VSIWVPTQDARLASMDPTRARPSSRGSRLRSRFERASGASEQSHQGLFHAFGALAHGMERLAAARTRGGIWVWRRSGWQRSAPLGDERHACIAVSAAGDPAAALQNRVGAYPRRFREHDDLAGRRPDAAPSRSWPAATDPDRWNACEDRRGAWRGACGPGPLRELVPQVSGPARPLSSVSSDGVADPKITGDLRPLRA